MNPFEKLDALYAGLPSVPCKRLCQRFCGAILLTRIEAARLEAKRGFVDILPPGEIAKRTYLPPPEIVVKEFVGLRPERDGLCVFLDRGVLGNCLAYKLRPAVCRLWGMVDNQFMRCPHGCRPTRWVTDAEAKALDEAIVEVQKEWEGRKAK
jgi:Fe-S-cluster containining protein